MCDFHSLHNFWMIVGYIHPSISIICSGRFFGLLLDTSICILLMEPKHQAYITRGCSLAPDQGTELYSPGHCFIRPQLGPGDVGAMSLDCSMANLNQLIATRVSHLVAFRSIRLYATNGAISPFQEPKVTDYHDARG